MPTPLTLRHTKKDMRDAVRRAETLLRNARQRGDVQLAHHGLIQVGIAEAYFEVALRANGGQITPELSRLDNRKEKIKEALRGFARC